MSCREIILPVLDGMKTFMSEEGKRCLDEQRALEDQTETGVLTDTQTQKIWDSFDLFYRRFQTLVSTLLFHYQHEADEEDIEMIKDKIGEVIAVSPSSIYDANLITSIPTKFMV